MLPRIHYIANNDAILPTLGQYFQTRGYEWIAYPIRETPAADYLFIVEPFRIRSELYAISTTWKPWLMEFCPQTRLIVAAYAQSLHPNCVNLLDLPDDLTGWLENTLPVSAFPLIYAEAGDEGEKSKFIDPWAFDLVKLGNDLNLQMRKFVIGHEESKSLFAQIAALRKQLQDLKHYQQYLDKSNEKTDLEQKWRAAREQIEKLWDYFYHRWKYYSDVFEYLPYQQASSKIKYIVDKLANDMEAVAETDQYPEITPLDALIQIIKKEMMPYIFPEDYW